MSKKAPVYLNAPTPLDDGGRKYNIIYAVGAVGCGLVAAVSGGFSVAIVGALFGLCMAYVIKACIVKVKWYGLREMKFALPHPTTAQAILQKLIGILTPMGMNVELNSDGTPVITYQNVIYDVNFNDDQTFTLWWRKSFARAFFSIDLFTIIPNYRKAVVAMGIIAYHIQQICAEQPENQPEEKNTASLKGRKCPNCGAALAEGTKFCGSCGTAVSEPQKQEEAKDSETIIRCPNCGSICEKGTKFCGSCGAKLS